MKKILFAGTLFSILISTISADNLADLLQDLAVQTACLGMYSKAETGVFVTSRYDDPPDWYDPPMMANRFARMSGNMTRIDTFYGVCFDYAQFAYDDISKYRELYNEAGMKGTEWYIVIANIGDPNTIILYDPVSEENATIISNGVYLKEKLRYKIYAHDGATGHAWLWVQHNNGTWYWIDPTWTDNTGYVWWGMVKDGKEVQYYPDPDYCVASNFPRPGAKNTETRSSDSTYSRNTNPSFYFLIGYNYSSFGFPVGFTIGILGLYTSWNLNLSAFSNVFSSGGWSTTVGSTPPDGITGETEVNALEFTVGYSFKLIDGFLRLPIGIGMSITKEYQYYRDNIGNEGWYDSGEEFGSDKKFIAEAGLQLTLIEFLYLSATYRCRWLMPIGTGLKKIPESGFTIGAGFIF